MPTRKFGGRTVTNEWITASELTVDRSYQRDLSESVIRKIVNEFDPDAIGTLYVSRRGNGDATILDGQQRCEATKRALGSEQKLPCLVYHGLTRREEAKLFVEYNRDRRRPHPIDIYRSEVEAHCEPALRVSKLLAERGLVVASTQGDPKVLRFPSTLKAVYRTGGEEVFVAALETMMSAGYGVEEVMGDLVFRAVALFHARYGALLDEQRLARAITGAQNALVGKARLLRSEYHSGSRTLAVTIMRLIFERYNRGLRNRLPWVDVQDRTAWRRINLDETA